LLAPSPHWLVGASEADGRAWVAMTTDFAKRPWAYEEPVVAALTSFCETHAIDPGRVFVVGEGSGALVAFDLAARAPGLVRGALIVDGPVHAALSGESASTAAASGSSVRVIVGRSAADPTVAAALFVRFLLNCGFGNRTTRIDDDANGHDSKIMSALGELLSTPPRER
jgi:pimeloyl-ACP methyl ester carboxylesterase